MVSADGDRCQNYHHSGDQTGWRSLPKQVRPRIVGNANRALIRVYARVRLVGMKYKDLAMNRYQSRKSILF